MSVPFSTEADPQTRGECAIEAVDAADADLLAAGRASSRKPHFDDGKAEQAFRTIGEVAKALAIRPHVLRYWEDQFPMLRPVKRSGGRRYYRQEDIQLVKTIDQLVHREGYTLRGARQKLEDEGKKAKRPSARLPVAPDQVAAAQCSKVIPEPSADSRQDDFRARLASIRTGLARALDG